MPLAHTHAAIARCKTTRQLQRRRPSGNQGQTIRMEHAIRIDTLTPIAIVAPADTAGSSTSCAPTGNMQQWRELACARSTGTFAGSGPVTAYTVGRPVCSEYSEYSGLV